MAGVVDKEVPKEKTFAWKAGEGGDEEVTGIWANCGTGE